MKNTKQNESTVEFIGGPFDGHRQSVNAPLHGNGGRLALPVNDNVFRMLAGIDVGPARRTPTVAIYELSPIDDSRYHFICSRPAAEFGLQDWKV